jgi:GH15 family glucan-1,4-alpha-glucosidase
MVNMADQPYKSLQDYGIIGNLHSAALVGMDGSIDWYCYPHFDSPSVFASILDASKGGRFKVTCSSAVTRKQLYFPDTNILVTRFLGSEGVGEVTDFMPVEESDTCHRIIRTVTAVRGHVSFECHCRPAFDYARSNHRLILTDQKATFQSSHGALLLTAPLKLTEDGNGGVTSSFTLKEGETATVALQALSYGTKLFDASFVNESESEELFRSTVRYWHDWLSKSQYRGRWRMMVNRSALVLKLLTFKPSGAIVAAPSSSLPEEIGGERNWDYRFSWIRDSAFTVYALLRIGFTGEAKAFMEWLMKRIAELKGGKLKPVYQLNGQPMTHEEILSHLDGYKDSRPVRIGNAASDQLQLDIYGALMDAVYLYNKHASPISYDLWTSLRRLLNWVSENWSLPDSGIWEMRSAPQHFVYSRMMCWVALDRGIRLAEKRGFPAPIDEWRKARDSIYEELMVKGWNDARQAFVQSYETNELDASSLLMPLVFFLSPADPRMLKTIDAVQHELTSDHLVLRYRTDRVKDGAKGAEGTFSLCTFWLVEALTRVGRLEEARMTFEKMLGYANHLGLFAEEISATGSPLGNFPQAFTHLAPITAAVNLDRALDRLT